MSKADVIRITNHLGNERLQAALDVGPHAIRHARWQGEFPASWYHQIDFMCREAGIACPRSAFRWRPYKDRAAA